MWKVDVAKTCIGSGVCAGTAPRHFTLGEDHRSRPLASLIEPDESVLDAAAACPMEAISLTDTETGELVEP